MAQDDLDIAGLARYLHLDLAKIERLLKREKIPGRRVAGQWRFSLPEINQWLEQQMGVADLDELEKMEESLSGQASSAPTSATKISELLKPDHIIKPLSARTKGSVIRNVCAEAVQLGLLWDASKMADLIQEREEMHSTALENGLALMHPRRPQPTLIGDPFILMGITPQGIPFGGPRGQLTDIFVLLASCEDAGHLQILARFSRVIQTPNLLNEIRSLETPQEIWDRIHQAELDLA